jgi:hypothetical protein
MPNLNELDLKKAFGEYKKKAEDNADFIIVGLLTLIALLLLISVCIEASKLRRVKALDDNIEYLADMEDAYLDCDCADCEDECDLDFGLEEIPDTDSSRIRKSL